MCFLSDVSPATHTLNPFIHTQTDGLLFEGVQAVVIQSVELGVVRQQVDGIGQGVLRLQLNGALWKRQM